MGRWNRGQSGNPKGRPKNGIAVAELARTQVEKHRLIEKLGSIGARQGEYADVEVDQQVRAIQLLLSYGYGPPRGPEIGSGSGEGIIIQVIYAERNQITIAQASPGARASDSGSETVQRHLLRPAMGEDRNGDGPPDSSGS